MTHKAAYEAVDNTLQDIKGNSKPMGGIPTLLCGDFRQILPVVKNGTRANIVNACLKKSYLWYHIQVMRLTTNMRARRTGDISAQQFSDLLLNIGNGTQPILNKPDTIAIPDSLGECVSSIEELKEKIFPGL